MSGPQRARPLRIALVTPGFSAGEEDWCIPVLRHLVRELAHEHEVTVYTLRYPHHRGSYDLFGARVRAFGGAARGGLRRLPLLWRAWRAIVRDGRRWPFSVVHGFWADEAGFVAALAARQLGVPAVVSLMGGELVALPQLDYGTQLSRSGRWLTGLSLRLAHVVTAGSPQLQAQAAPYVGHAGARLLPLGVDTTLFHPGSPPAAGQPGEGGARLLHVGSLVPVKDQATLLEAFAGIARAAPRARLDVVGEGPLQPALERQARSLGLQERVTFHGAVAHHHLPAFYRRADLFLLSSRFESQNLAFLEAAACGLPTVGSAVGLLPALLPDACLAPPGDAPALTAAALRLLHDPARRRALARDLRRRVLGELTIEGTVERLVGVYGGVGSGD